jgi:hypothetical protein
MKKTLVTLLIAVGCSMMLIAGTALSSSANSLTAKANLAPTSQSALGVGVNVSANQSGVQTSGSLAGLQNYSGVISGVSNDLLTLKLGDGSTVNVKLGTNTQTNVPSLGVNATVNGLLVNQQANVTAHADANQSLVADEVQVNPGTVNADVSLDPTLSLVTAYQPGVSITVKDNSGQLTLFQLTGNTRVSPTSANLGVGSYVSITPLHDMVCGPLTAGNIVVSDGSTSVPATSTPAPSGYNGSSGNGGSAQSSTTDSSLLNLNANLNPTDAPLLSLGANVTKNPITYLLNLLTGNQ